MPKYGLNKYGRFKYGKYILNRGTGSSFVLGPHVRYRIRNILSDGTYTEYLTMCQDRMEITGNHPQIRLRVFDSNDVSGDWTYTQQEVLRGDVFKVKIRSIDSNGNPSDWVYGDKGTLS